VYAISTEDLDKDGLSDVVLATTPYYGPDFRFLYGNQWLGLAAPVSMTWPTNLGPFVGNSQGSLWHFFTYDGDGDGDTDLVRIGSFGVTPIPTYPFSSFSMRVYVLNATGYRTYASSVRQDATVPAPAGSKYTPADYDQDGDIDLIGVPSLINSAVYLDNSALFGSGCSGIGGVPPLSFQGGLSLGNGGYFLAVAGAAPLAPAALAISLGANPAAGCGVYVDLSPGQLILPSAGLGVTTTDTNGVAILGIPLPSLPSLAGITAYAQWFVADPAGGLSVGASTFAASRGRTLILW
jgi:hypothetical protein